MIRGQKVELDLGSDSDDEAPRPSAPLPASFVGDVLERKPSAPKAPILPKLKSQNGFPEHKKRNTETRFKSQKTSRPQNGLGNSSATPGISERPQAASSSPASGEHASGKAKSWEEDEKERIDEENRQRIAAMSSEEIEEQRRELMHSLGPGFLQKLLARANVESGSNEVDLSRGPDQDIPSTESTEGKPTKSAKFAEEPQFEDADADEERRRVQATRQADAPAEDTLPHDTVHFPRPPQPPELDPSSETFLEDLHQKYFPYLPADPDKLEWMQSSAPAKNSYDPSASALNAGDIRFNFKGELIPPSKANALPVTLGLHHHADAPEAAGYTIAELAHLARSSYAAQRCIAFQTLGRILYRLSKGEFGDPGEPEQVMSGEAVEGPENTFGELARGLWREVERLQVVQILVDESEGRGVDGGKHMSAKAYATEAVWLWRKGGGRRWKAA